MKNYNATGRQKFTSIWWNSARWVASRVSFLNTRSIEKYFWGWNSFCWASLWQELNKVTSCCPPVEHPGADRSGVGAQQVLCCLLSLPVVTITLTSPTSVTMDLSHLQKITVANYAKISTKPFPGNPPQTVWFQLVRKWKMCHGRPCNVNSEF